MPDTSLVRSSQDIVFTVPTAFGGGTLKCMVARGKGKDGRAFEIKRMAVPAEEGQQRRLRETAQTYSDWTRGAGFGKASPDTEGGFNYGTRLYARSRNMLMPAGEVTEYALPVGTGTLTSAFDLIGSTWVTAGNTRMVQVINNGTDLTVRDAGVDFGVGAQSGSGVVFGDRAWIANSGGRRIYSFDGTTWTPAVDDVRRGSLVVADWVFGAQYAPSAGMIGTTQRVLVSNDTSIPSVYHCVTNPGLTASWAGPNPVGDSAIPIQSLHGAGEAVFAAKPDGVFMIEGGGRMRNLAPHWRNQYDPSSGESLQYYDGALLAGHTQFLDMLAPNPDQIGQMNPCQPGAHESFENSPIFGRTPAQTIDSGYVLTAFYSTSGRSYVMAGKRTDRLNLTGRNQMTWYGSEFDCDGRITLLYIIASVNNGPRWLMIGAAAPSGATKLYFQSLPREPTPYAAWKRSGAHRFSTAFTCKQSLDDLGDPNAPKNMRYIAVVTENAATTRSLTVTTTTDGSDEVVQATITEPGRQFTVVDDATSSGVNVETMLSGTCEPTEPLVIRSVKIRGTINDERTVVYEVPLVFGRDVPGNRGTDDASSPWIKRAQLYTLLEAGPVALNDWNGLDRTGVVEDVQDREIPDDEGDGVTVYAIATISILLNTARYGSARAGFSRFA